MYLYLTGHRDQQLNEDEDEQVARCIDRRQDFSMPGFHESHIRNNPIYARLQEYFDLLCYEHFNLLCSIHMFLLRSSKSLT